MRRIGAIAMLGVVAGVAVGGADTTRWVERTKADVRAGRGSYHEVVDTLLKGEQVQVVATEARWLSVRTPRAKTGWVFEAALSAKPVEPGSSDFLKLAPGDAATSRTAASQGAKGVYAQNYARERGFDYGVVQWIEQHQPSAQDVEAFAREPEGAPGERR
jgi:uncharacterized protein YgiM (DUF1202 family)